MDMYRFDWLALQHEEAVDPERRIIDAHHHLWSTRAGDYLVADLQTDTSATHNITHTVFVECMARYDRDVAEHLAPVGETRFVAAQAAECEATGGSQIGAIVSFADLMLGDAVEDVLAAHKAAGQGLFRGIRHATGVDDDAGRSHTKPQPEMMMTPEFRSGAARLGAMGHSFDAWLYHHQLPELLELARATPELPIVLDHLGAPLGIGSWADRGDEVLAALRSALTDLADCPNVVLKLGGIGMEHYYGGDWSTRSAPPTSDEVADRWGDQIRWSIDLFGPDRCLFESNFPVDRQTLPYSVLWNALQKVAASYSDAEQNALFFTTAQRVYRIDAESAENSSPNGSIPHVTPAGVEDARGTPQKPR